MRQQINQFFDVLQLLIDKAPILHHFVVELALLGLLIVGVIHIFRNKA